MRYLEACRVLGISPDASEEEGQSAFRHLAQQHHPDKGGDAKQFRHIAGARKSFLRYRGLYQRHQKKHPPLQGARVQAAKPYSPEEGRMPDDEPSYVICFFFWFLFSHGFYFFLDILPLYLGAAAVLTLALCVISRKFRSSIILPLDSFQTLLFWLLI